MNAKEQFTNLLNIAVLDTDTLIMIQNICLDVQMQSNILEAIVENATTAKLPYVTAKAEAIDASFNALLTRVFNITSTGETIQTVYDSIDAIIAEVTLLSNY